MGMIVNEIGFNYMWINKNNATYLIKKIIYVICNFRLKFNRKGIFYSRIFLSHFSFSK